MLFFLKKRFVSPFFPILHSIQVNGHRIDGSRSFYSTGNTAFNAVQSPFGLRTHRIQADIGVRPSNLRLGRRFSYHDGDIIKDRLRQLEIGSRFCNDDGDIIIAKSSSIQSNIQLRWISAKSFMRSLRMNVVIFCKNKILKMLRPIDFVDPDYVGENFVIPVLSYMPLTKQINGENPKEDGNVQEDRNFLFRQQSRKIGLKKEAFSRTDRRFQTSPAVVSITYEEIGLFPRSFSRVFDRFIKQIFSDVENLVIQEYRFYRYLFLTTLKCIFLLIFLPFLVNLLAKQILVQPFTEYFWNTKQSEIFLNSYQQKRAFEELEDFEEKLYFESLLPTGQSIFGSTSSIRFPFDKYVIGDAQKENDISFLSPNRSLQSHVDQVDPAKSRKSLGEKSGNETSEQSTESIRAPQPTVGDNAPDKNFIYSIHKGQPVFLSKNSSAIDESVFSEKNLPPFGTISSCPIQLDLSSSPIIKDEEKDLMTNDLDRLRRSQLRCDVKKIIEQRLQQKTVELAIRYNNESIEAITNFFADLLSFMTLGFLFFAFEIQINITKSFLLEVFFGLDDSKKSLMILLVTDLLVGYHSSNLWELFFQFLFNHYGLPENQTGIFLLVATFPVLLDVLFKYLIFRHLNRASPATVATYHAMIE